jgi:hypothetical protein
MQLDGARRAHGPPQAIPKPAAAASLRPLWLVPVLLGFGPALTDADTQRAAFTVSTYVTPKTSLTAAAVPGDVELTAADLARGYKDVNASYRVTSNAARGYVLQFSTRAGLTRAIEVRGLGAPVQFGTFGAEIPLFGRQRLASKLDLQFRLHLAADARTGAYAMPVVVSANPL